MYSVQQLQMKSKTLVDKWNNYITMFHKCPQQSVMISLLDFCSSAQHNSSV